MRILTEGMAFLPVFAAVAVVVAVVVVVEVVDLSLPLAREALATRHAYARSRPYAPPPPPPPPPPPLPSIRVCVCVCVRAVCPYILGNEFCERLAFNGLSTNLVMYLTRVMGEDNGQAALQVNLFSGTCYLTPLLGAWIADSFLGRYRTIMAFSAIYFAGMVALAATALVPSLTPPPDRFPTWWQDAALFTSLYVIALGTGGIKPNVSAFGADQFDVTDPRDRREKDSFFNAFYFFINLGSLLAVTVIVYVQENVSWGIGFAVPAATMGLAILTFWLGSDKYSHVPPTESPIARVFRISRAALRERRRARAVGARGGREAADGPESRGLLEGAEAGDSFSASADAFSSPAGVSSANASAIASDDLSDFAAVASSGERSQTSSSAQAPSSSPVLAPSAPGGLRPSASMAWLDGALAARCAPGGARTFSARQVEEVKLVLRMLPIFATTAFYWTAYAQMGSVFVEQGAYMDRRTRLPFGLGSFEVPSASVTLINTLAVIVLIPIYDRVLLPLCRSFGYRMTLLRRIGWGLAVTVVAMLAAAWLEAVRLGYAKQGRYVEAPWNDAVEMGPGTVGNRSTLQQGADLGSSDLVSGTDRLLSALLSNVTSSAMSSPAHPPRLASADDPSWGKPVALSIWWQTPQYFLVGLSEIFTSIGQLEFFYDQAPDVMRSCSMALQLLSVAVGSYVAAGMVAVVSSITVALDPKGRGWLPKNLNKGRVDLLFVAFAVLSAIDLVVFLWVARTYQYKSLDHRRTAAPASARRPVVPKAPHRAHAEERHQAGPQGRTRPLPFAARPVPTRGAASSPAPDPYGRSVTYVPASPIWPTTRR